MPIKAGIIGTGKNTGIASAHLEGYNASEGVKVCGIFDTNREAAKKWALKQNIPDICIYTSLEQLLDEVDAVSICTPNFTHVSFILAALKKNRHVLCEKPVGVPLDDLDGLKKMCLNTDVVTMIDFNYRRIPGLRMIQDLIERGEIGKIYFYRHTMGGDRIANENVPFEWRMDRNMSGSGSFGDFGSHILDTLFFLTGVSACGIKNVSLLQNICIPFRSYNDQAREVENDDCSVLQGRLPDGAFVSIMTSRVGTLGNNLEIIASNAVIKFDMIRPEELLIKWRRRNADFDRLFTRYSDKKLISDFGWPNAVQPEMLACADNVREFVSCIKNNNKPITDIVYGIEILEAIDAMEINAIKENGGNV
jgi:predicted dehydrogenase